MSDLPQGLAEDIRWGLYNPLVVALPLFNGCHESFMAALQVGKEWW